MYTLNGKTLRLDKAFTTEDGRQFPRNWLRLSTKAERDALGIVETPDAPVVSYDQRFYWGPENPKDLDQLKEQWTSQVKQTAGSLLAQTDWYVIRQSENSSGVPADVLARRSEIRTFSNAKEIAIDACVDVDDLATYVTGPDFNRWEQPTEPVVDGTATDAGIAVTAISGGFGSDTITFE